MIQILVTRTHHTSRGQLQEGKKYNFPYSMFYELKTLEANDCLTIINDNFIEEEINEKPRINPVSLKDVFFWKKDKSFVVQDFLFPKTVNMLFSPPGGFKSLLTLDLCLCIAAGEPWLGLKTKKGKVLILDRENSNKDIRDRVVSLINGHKWKRRLKSIYANFLIRRGTLNDIKFLEDLNVYVKENNVCLIVIDTLRRYSSFEENSSDGMNQLYTAFQEIIGETGAAILFLHHTNKEGETYRGSVDLLGQVDTAFKIIRKNKENEFTIVCEKNRSGEIDKIQGTIEWDKDNEITTITKRDVEEHEEEDKYAKFKKTKYWVLEQVKQLCPMVGSTFLRTSVMKKLDSENVDLEKDARITMRTIERVLFHLVEKRYLVRTGKKGEYRRLFTGDDNGFKPQERIN